MTGWIKLHRQIEENELYFTEKFTKIMAWIDLLILAGHKDRTMFIRGIEINLLAGQLCWSQLNLAKRWNWNFKTVNKFLLLLENRKMITYKTDKITTIITILNWKDFQGNGEQNGVQNAEQNGEQRENNLETNKNGKNVKNEKNEKKRDIFIPPILEEVKEHFVSKGILTNEYEKFFYYYESNGWSVGKNKMKNWQSAANGWISRNEVKIIQTTPIVYDDGYEKPNLDK